MLDPVQRSALCLAMLGDILEVLSRSPEVDAVLVTSPDQRVLSVAASAGALPVVDTAGTLNGAIAAAINTSVAMGATAALVLPGDVPLVTPADIATLVAALPPRQGLVIAPTWDGGTGALLLRPPGVMQPAYGPHSFHRHLVNARKVEVPVAIRLLPNLAMDLDRPEDLDRFFQKQKLTCTGEFLATMHIDKQGDQACM